jgi:hypothetical protein
MGAASVKNTIGRRLQVANIFITFWANKQRASLPSAFGTGKINSIGKLLVNRMTTEEPNQGKEG